jgi:peptidoglycan/xylan/chitin deacetylase (PgdA/CDA1 family)
MKLNIGKRDWGRRYWLPLVHRRPMPLQNVGPVVSFTFDDFPRTAYTTGGRILENYGVRGTFYAALGLMDSTNLSGQQFSLDDLHSVVTNGHELASHTLHHVSSQATSLSAFLQEVQDGRSALQQVSDHLWVSRNFAYPFGSVTSETKRVVAREMSSCRGIYRGVNRRMADISLLRANPLYGDIDQLDFVGGLIRETAESAGWLIFYTHDVRRSPSTCGCTPALLESAIKAALDRSMTILTVDEVLARALRPSKRLSSRNQSSVNEE